MRRLLIALTTMLLMASFSATATERVKILTGEWAPYTSENLEGYGFFAEIITAVFEEMGMQVDYEFHTWKRCESLLKSGEAFAAMPYVVTEERKKYYDFSNVVAVSTGRFFYLKAKIHEEVLWEKYTDLKPYRVGGVLGYWYERPFIEAKLTVEFVQAEEGIMKRLQAGRVDLVPMDELVGWAMLKNIAPNELADFDTLKKPINVSELHLMISKNYPNANEIREKFNVALKTIKRNGVYSRILKKYNIKE